MARFTGEGERKQADLIVSFSSDLSFLFVTFIGELRSPQHPRSSDS
ncbi:MAG: hypothetical protein ACFCBU_01385 [Cyanophyceae cyanobacterium]